MLLVLESCRFIPQKLQIEVENILKDVLEHDRIIREAKEELLNAKIEM